MPTYEYSPRFWREYLRLTPRQRAAFLVVVRKFVRDLRIGVLRAGLQVKSVSGHPDVYEITWADDGRATYSYGESVHPGHVHINQRRIGTHDIFNDP